MILPYAKTFNEKMREQLVKIWREKKEKQLMSDFSTFSIDDMKTKKKHKYVVLVLKVLSNSQNTAIFTRKG